MTPQEQELVNQLFDRLAELESNPRDPNAERLIADGLRRAPHAVYVLVQTALVQDEALKRANARIEECRRRSAARSNSEAAASSTACATPSSAGASREAPCHRYARKHNLHPQRLRPIDRRQDIPRRRRPIWAPGMGPAFGSGGSFLGTAASTAAGVIGGGLLLSSIRSMFGIMPALANTAGRVREFEQHRRDNVAQKDRDQDQDQDQDDEDQA